MANRITWFTQPETNGKDLHFSSFYMYDTDNRDFVRIRLDLAREDNEPPTIFIEKEVSIGFSKTEISEDEIAQAIDTLDKKPTVGYYTYDKNENYIHSGNVVIIKGKTYLPKGITNDDLEKIAQKLIDSKEIKLCNSGDKVEVLENKLKELM